MSNRAVLEELEQAEATTKKYGGSGLSDHDIKYLTACGLADILRRLERIEQRLEGSAP